jgi:hypothetical protein
MRRLVPLAVLPIALLALPPPSLGASSPSARSCGHHDEQNYYRMHISVRGTSCVRAHRVLHALHREGIPANAGPVPWRYGTAGPPFSLGAWTCTYTPEGLGGSEYTLRCTLGSRTVRLRRVQDGSRRFRAAA